MVSFGVLGPLTAENKHGPVNLKGPRHRAVLARLLVARGRVVPVTWLIDDLWEDPPDGALGAVQTFVGALRKALEPDRPKRTPSRLLITASPGYALRAEPEAVDAWRFEVAVDTSAQLLANGKADEARVLLDDALALWRGPAYAEFAEQDWACGEAARLHEVRLLAVERRAEAALASGQAAESVPGLEAHVLAHPLREGDWRLLALALYRAGRQGDALATLRRARDALRTQLGVDPGEDLRQLEADVLAQAPHLTVRPAVQQIQHPFVGRDEELTHLAEAAKAVVAAGRPRLVLISGIAGAGKTALIRAFSARLGTAWAVDPELPDVADASDDPVAARFQRHRAIGAHLAAMRRPVLLVFDDLHWADEENPALLNALASDDTAGPVLIIGTYRSTEISAELAEALSRAARTEPARIYLGGLTEPQVHEMVKAIAGHHVDAHMIHARSAGNPFFVRELIRLWETDGVAAMHTVPAGVRDVIRHRLAGLTETARTHMHQAAIIGQDVALDVLIPLAGDEAAVLDSIESALLAGFLVEPDADRVRFAHALVQETLYADTTRARRARWHAAVAEVIEGTRPDDVDAIAHHFLRAESRATAARAAHYARLAAQRAERRFAPHEAARMWRETLTSLERLGTSDARARLEARTGLVKALAIAGDLQQARHHRAEAITLAENLGDPLLTADVINSFDVPAIWTANDDEALSARLVAAAERTLAVLPADRVAERARLLITIAMERRADAGQRGNQAAQEAEAIARDLGDPTLLAFALNGRFMQTFHRAGLAPQRAALGVEILDLATREGLITFEVLGHLILMQANAALADLAAADRHAAEADRLAERYEIPLVGVFTGWYAALRLAVTGKEARTAYQAAAARLTGAGMPGVEAGIRALALLCLDVGNPPQDVDWGPYEAWARPFVLLSQGKRAEAFAAAGTIPDSPRDLLFEARTCLHAMVAIQAGDRPTMARLYTELLPAADELAGAGSGMVSLGPTAQHLGDLAAALGRHHEASAHYRQAHMITGKAGASGRG
jgi:DNA-binding SARP family transcriptional activator